MVGAGGEEVGDAIGGDAVGDDAGEHAVVHGREVISLFASQLGEQVIGLALVRIDRFGTVVHLFCLLFGLSDQLISLLDDRVRSTTSQLLH